MRIKIKIEKQDLGISPKAVRSLLSKLSQIQDVRTDDTLEIELNFTKKDASELSTAIIWKSLSEVTDAPFKKNIRFKGGVTEKYLNERHFFDSLTGKKSKLFSTAVPINYETFSPIRPTKSSPQNEEVNKIFEESTRGILDTSKDFEREIRIHMVECVQNTFDHSESQRNKPAGIICSLSERGMLDFCVIDKGKGIKKSFLSNLALKAKYLPMSDAEAIVSSTQENVSCNPTDSPNPSYSFSNGGIGLYYLNEFIQMHTNSHLIIVSDTGYYSTSYLKKQRKTANLTSKWSGTIIYFRIKLDQNMSKAYEALNVAYIENFDNN